jgi:hypothetical protein
MPNPKQTGSKPQAERQQPPPNAKKPQQDVSSVDAVRWREDLEQLGAVVDHMAAAGVAAPSDAPPPAIDMLRLLTGALKMEGDESLEAALGTAVRRGCAIANAAVVASAKSEDPPTDAERARIQRVLSTLYYLNQALSASTVAWRVLSSSDEAAGGGLASDDDLAAGLSRFSAPDAEEANRVQQLLLYLLNTAQASWGLRERGGVRASRPSVPERPHLARWGLRPVHQEIR